MLVHSEERVIRIYQDGESQLQPVNTSKTTVSLLQIRIDRSCLQFKFKHQAV